MTVRITIEIDTEGAETVVRRVVTSDSRTAPAPDADGGAAAETTATQAVGSADTDAGRAAPSTDTSPSTDT